MRIILTKTDIVPLVIEAWIQSFARVNKNQQAISDRGWGPLNRVILLDPEILKTKPKIVDCDDEQGRATPTPMTAPITELMTTPTPTTIEPTAAAPTASEPLTKGLNFAFGYAGETMTDLLQHALKQKCVADNFKNDTILASRSATKS